ncbi:hypothetical protein LTR56_000318 [Elasticomyces elasticus]|nr:hypothetical protein LTR56_000318 [Elasticomyces elasticus]KAK3666986.1 hypothetical protein LTR22_002211 [Elasticomyces elasticus]KAK4933310.1 hypothetical protein LTR49_000304 [Elasticomyces elasticus]KAK5757336.1 hypothetical protein LTS12_012548 [Elasticomyces elasticus]
MRLLNTSTFELEYYEDVNLVPEYAIFSHKWYTGGEEVILLDFQRPGNAPHKKGFSKLQGLCSVAAAKGHRFVWCDACCIEKSNEVELSKSINSMFRWYQNAAECIAFLGDVGGDDGRLLEHSIYFKRGWTLQELIAPQDMTFYDQHWNCLGTKKDLLDALSNITRIPRDVLSHHRHFSTCSVAQRMSWASDRETREVEDQAYSLMGLFDISLKLIYGEGEKAFIKLQREIIASSADQSIFSWKLDNRKHRAGSSLLAPSPHAFAECGNIVPTSVQKPYSLTNIGLSIQWYTWPHSMETYLAFLDCSEVGSPRSEIAILIAKLPTADQYLRVTDWENGSVFRDEAPSTDERRLRKSRQIFMRETTDELPLNRSYGFWLRTIEPPRFEGCEIRILPRASTTAKECVMLAPGMVGDAGIISIDPKNKKGSVKWSFVRWIKLQFDDDFHPMVVILNEPRPSILRGRLNQRTFDLAFNDRQRTDSLADQELFSDFSWLKSKQSQSGQFGPKPDRANKWDGGGYSMTSTNTKKGGNIHDFEDLNLRVRLTLLPDPFPKDGRSANASSTGRTKYIWTVDITEYPADLKSGFPWSALRSLITGKE